MGTLRVNESLGELDDDELGRLVKEDTSVKAVIDAMQMVQAHMQTKYTTI